MPSGRCKATPLAGLLLALLLGFTPLNTRADTIVGDWWQESLTGDRKHAVTQPIAQTTDQLQVTLGIRGAGTPQPIEFFLLVSNHGSGPSCLYTAEQFTIDREVFPLTSDGHHSDVEGIRTTSVDRQKQLWQHFRKGQILRLTLDRACDGTGAVSRETSIFEFSLKGSSAAYRFITGLKPAAIVKTPKPVPEAPANKPEPTAPLAEEAPDSGLAPLIMPVVILLAVILLVRRILKRAGIGRARKPARIPDRRVEPRLGNRARQDAAFEASINRFRATREAASSPNFEPTQTTTPGEDITSLPSYKVEHVIDGDTVVLSNPRREIRVRLDAIDCPEDGQAWGDIATAGLIKMIGGRHVLMEEHGTDRYERMLGTLYVLHDNGAEWINVNERMVTLGHAWVMRRYYQHLPQYRRDKLNRLERWAKSKKVGLWKTPDPVPPWAWRNGGQT